MADLSSPERLLAAAKALHARGDDESRLLAALFGDLATLAGQPEQPTPGMVRSSVLWRAGMAADIVLAKADRPEGS